MNELAYAEWKKLNKAINCRHYIGTKAWRVIDDALNTPQVMPDKNIKVEKPKVKPAAANPVVKPKPKASK